VTTKSPEKQKTQLPSYTPRHGELRKFLLGARVLLPACCLSMKRGAYGLHHERLASIRFGFFLAGPL